MVALTPQLSASSLVCYEVCNMCRRLREEVQQIIPSQRTICYKVVQAPPFNMITMYLHSTSAFINLNRTKSLIKQTKKYLLLLGVRAVKTADRICNRVIMWCHRTYVCEEWRKGLVSFVLYIVSNFPDNVCVIRLQSKEFTKHITKIIKSNHTSKWGGDENQTLNFCASPLPSLHLSTLKQQRDCCQREGKFV